MTVLVTGGSGLLGANAVLDLRDADAVIGVARRAPVAAPVEFLEVDLADPAARDGLVERAGASLILHTAALSSIEQCERDPQLAHALNVEASADLARQAALTGAAFVHISTDAVFDGAVGQYGEDDAPTPQTAYGRTKLAGEHAVLDAHPGALVARVNFYGWSPSGRRSLAEFFVNRLARGERTPGFTDVRVSTMYVRSLVDRLRALLAVSAHGVVHVVGDEPLTKYELGVRIARAFGYDESLMEPALSADHLDVRRGSDLSLRTDRLRSLTGEAGSDPTTDVARLVADAQDGRRAGVRAFASNHEESQT